jgi:hypothetical protein
LFTCLTTAVVVVFMVLGLAIGAILYLKPRLSAQAGDTLALQLDHMIDQKIEDQTGSLGEIPDGFTDTIVVPEADINDYLQQNPQDIAPLESATVRFVPGQMQATVTAYGMSGTASAGITTQNGDIEVVNPKIDGALGFVLDAGQLASTLEASLNSQMDSSGLSVTSAQVEQGQLVLSVEK